MAQKDLFNRYIGSQTSFFKNDGVTRDEINRRWSGLKIAFVRQLIQ